MEDDGVGLVEYLTEKYGTAASQQFLGSESSLHRSGRKVGIEFKNDTMYPTRRAHALMEHVKLEFGDQSGKANLIMETLFQKYFEAGENPNSLDTLRAVAERVFGKGELADKALGAADSEEMLHQVLEKNSYFKTGQGVSGVPFFIIEKVVAENEEHKKKPSVTFSGAYPPYIIAQELEEMAED